MSVTRRYLICLTSAALVCMTMIGCTTTGTTTRNNSIVDEFEASKDRAPSADTLYAMARILVDRGQDLKAAYVLRRLLDQYPDMAEAYNELAELQMRHDHMEDAIATLEAGLAVAPDHASLHNNRGMAAMMAEDYAAAVSHFEQAIELCPRSMRYHNNKATALGLNGDYDAALSAYLVSLPRNQAHGNLALLCDARGDHERAASERQLAATVQ
ncbi:MAG: tetratricopeptide repeat protein [Phycisphaeraceae bacterium]|nr:tetratricopeptide repeat protein [Phycisphaeraceae bacterium]